MEFSSLVLMEKDKETNFIVKELGSYEVVDGAEYITKMFFDGDKVNLYFDTKQDVEDWEYSAVFDLFDEEEFVKHGYSIEQVDDEFNPTWLVKFDFIEEHTEMADKLNEICNLIEDCITKVLEDIKGKQEKYEE